MGRRIRTTTATDFLFVDHNGSSDGAGQRLGAPGPEGLTIADSPQCLFRYVPARLHRERERAPNRVREFTSEIP
jgi:hypothetical protein